MNVFDGLVDPGININNQAMDINDAAVIGVGEIFPFYTSVTAVDKRVGWDKTVILKSYDLDNFVGIGHPTSDDTNPQPQKLVSNESANDISGGNYIQWNLTDSDVTNTGLLLTYNGKRLWYVYVWNEQPNVISQLQPDGTFINHVFLCEPYADGTQGDHIVGRLDFKSSINVQNNHNITNLTKTPFHIESGETTSTEEAKKRYFLCFNKGNSLLAETVAWECKIFIVDSNNPYFIFNPEINTLELPSIYKPFYLRALCLVKNDAYEVGEDEVYKTRVVGNIYNGIGVLNDDKTKYVIGRLLASVNETNISTEISGNTPTLLANYTNSIHSFTSLSRNSLDNTERFEGAVTGLTDINLTLKLEENIPEGNNTFLPNTLYYSNIVSFYKIKYRRSRQTGSVLTRDIQYCMRMESFQGNSNGNVAYYFVSPHFWKKFVTMTIKVTGGTEDITVDFNDIIKCNTEQKYELSPNLCDEQNDDFLSLYDTFYFSSYREYMLWYVENFYFVPEFAENMPDPNEYSYVIKIDTDEVINGKFDNDGQEVDTVFTIHNKKNKVSKDWLIIGITDPLLNLIDSDLFKEEKFYGSVLTPHKNFVSIMTIAQPTIIDEPEENE